MNRELAPPEAAARPPAEEIVPCSMRELLLYFLRLGTLGFGGPIALAGHMQRDLVEERRWFSKQDYLEGLALSQLSPGPLAAQLAKYLGWVRAGIPGATLVAAAFIGPSFAMVLAISWLYLHFGGLPGIQALFYGIGAAVIAIIARSAVKLARATVGADRVLIGLFVLSAVVTGWTEKEYVWLVFGSGLAIVPFLHGGVVDDFHWLNERQFLDAVAVAMITPGPVVITVAFIGFLVAGLSGALVSAVGVFLPPYLIVIFLAPHFRRWSGNPRVKVFVAGVTAAAAGAIAGAAYVLGRRAIVDLPTAIICAVVLLLLVKARKIPEPVLILGAGAAGLVLRHGFAG